MGDEDLRAIAETAFGAGPRKDHLAVVYANGDVIVYEWRPASPGRPSSWGVALAGFRWDGARLRLALGRMPDPRAQRALETWLTGAVRPVPGSSPVRLETPPR